MSAPAVPLLSAAEMRAWDERAIRGLGVPEAVLMESAGRAAAEVLHRLFPRGRVVAAVGRGNNGGDAVVVLRTLAAWGRDVAAVPVDGAPLPGALLHGWPLEVIPPARAAGAFAAAGVLVDGLLGTGASGAPREPYAALIRLLNAAGGPIVALDGPSGVDFTTGAAPGEAVRAAVTVSFGAPKRGLLLHPGRAHAGRLLVVEIGFPPLAAGEYTAEVVTPGWVAARLPVVPADAHKGVLGLLAVVAGQEGMAGAAALVGLGAARTGVGKVRLVSPAANRVILQAARPEALFADRDGPGGEHALADADAAVVGPGMGTDAAAEAALDRVLAAGSTPLLLDADALTLLARRPERLAVAAGRPLLLTPHPGEMARLFAVPVAEVGAAPFDFAARAAERFGCAVLLKGWPALVAAPGQPVRVNPTGHAGMATGGMGDTLAGIAGALLARGAPPAEAASLALYLAGRAADLLGRRPLLPQDVAEAVPLALAELAAGGGGAALPGELAPCLRLELPPP